MLVYFDNFSIYLLPPLILRSLSLSAERLGNTLLVNETHL